VGPPFFALTGYGWQAMPPFGGLWLVHHSFSVGGMAGHSSSSEVNYQWQIVLNKGA